MEVLFLKLLPIFIIFVFLASVIKIASKNQRFALFNIGNFVEFKGPGLLFKWPWSAIFWERLTVGDHGELISNELAKFKDIEIPIKCEGEVSIGSRIRITDFSEKHALVKKDPDLKRSIICEKCGHKMEI